MMRFHRLSCCALVDRLRALCDWYRAGGRRARRGRTIPLAVEMMEERVVPAQVDFTYALNNGPEIGHITYADTAVDPMLATQDVPITDLALGFNGTTYTVSGPVAGNVAHLAHGIYVGSDFVFGTTVLGNVRVSASTNSADLTLPDAGNQVLFDNLPMTILTSANSRAPEVSVMKVSDAAEGGASGVFRFSRTGNTSQALTVSYTVGGTATAGTDYTALSGSVTFAAGASTVDVVVSAGVDNEFDDADAVTVTLVAPEDESYTVGQAATASLAIADDPPQVTQTLVWQQVGTQIGQVTLTRSGGDLSQPLTTWFELTGTVNDNGTTLSVVMAASAVIAAGETSLTVAILADPNNGGIANVQMPGAAPVAPRADQSQQLTAYMGSLNDAPEPDTILADKLRFAEVLDSLRGLIAKLPSPITYPEYLALQSIRAKLQSLPAGTFADGGFQRMVLIEVIDSKVQHGIDWRTVPPSFSIQGVVGSPEMVVGVLTAVADWATFQQTFDGLAANLGSEDFQEREDAAAAIRSLFGRYLLQTDFAHAGLVAQMIVNLGLTSDNPEVKKRVEELLRFVNREFRYLPQKLAIIAALSTGLPPFGS